MNVSFRHRVQTLGETDELGETLARLLPAELAIGLTGPLGAGKTRFVQAVAAALGVARDQVVSPTFVLCQHYFGRHALHHMDAYRLYDEDEFLALGPEENFSSGITFVEWADRVADCLPRDHLMIAIEPNDGESREFSFEATGPRSGGVVNGLRKVLGSEAR